jgi:hypothetical protein
VASEQESLPIPGMAVSNSESVKISVDQCPQSPISRDFGKREWGHRVSLIDADEELKFAENARRNEVSMVLNGQVLEARRAISLCEM